MKFIKNALFRNRPIGRLEFRNALAGQFTLVAIHDYAPALPWFIYKFTQAPLHLLVMKWFSAYLKRA